MRFWNSLGNWELYSGANYEIGLFDIMLRNIFYDKSQYKQDYSHFLPQKENTPVQAWQL